jgi:hypothetical protein
MFLLLQMVVPKPLLAILFSMSFVWVNSSALYSQTPPLHDSIFMDSIFFLNGEVKAVKLIDTINSTIKFIYPKNNKILKHNEVESAKVFSVKYGHAAERILYFKDSSIGNVFSILEAKMFMLGEREAEKNYKNKWPFIIGISSGVASPLLLSNAIVLSPILPAVMPLHTHLPRIHIRTSTLANKNYLNYDTYLMGYERAARKKNFIHALWGAAIGFATGLGTWAIIR